MSIVVKSKGWFSWYNLLYYVPNPIVRFEAVRIGQSINYTGVWLFNCLLGIYQEDFDYQSESL